MAKNIHSFVWLRRLAAVFLFGIFAYSITPVVFLHDVFATHHDVCYHNFHNTGKQLSKADINCNTFFFIAEAQFLLYLNPLIIAAPETIFAERTYDYTVSFYSRHHFFAELRGPPAIA